MFRHYIKLVFRIFYRNRLYSLISLAGLVIAFTVSFLIFTYAIHELKVNRNYNNYHTMYQLITHDRIRDEWYDLTPKDIGPALKNSIPEIEGMSRISRTRVNFEKEGIQLKVPVLFVDQDFFKLFADHGGIQPDLSLKDPYSVIVTKDFVKKFFNDSLKAGQVLEISIWDVKEEVTVEKVIDGFGKSSSLQADMIGNMELFLKIANNPILEDQRMYATFILLPEKINIKEIETKIDKFTNDQFYSIRLVQYRLRKFSDFYLNSGNLGSEFFPVGDIGRIRWFLTTAVLLLIIASINYSIISTAHAMSRRKEFGVRKTFGSGKSSIRLQAMSESFIMTFISLPLAVLITMFLAPWANQFWGKSIDFNMLHNPELFLIYVAIVIVTGLFSGAYLSFYISGMNPVWILQAKKRSHNVLELRQFLLIVQFMVFSVLVTFSFVLIKQLHYTRSKDMGYNLHNILTVECWDMDGNSKRIDPRRVSLIETLKGEISKFPGVEGVAQTDEAPPYRDESSSQAAFRPDEPDNIYIFMMLEGDNDLEKVLDYKVIEGRALQKNAYDEILLNEAAVRILGYKNAVGQKLNFASKDYTIVGVVKDFNIQSFRKKINPLIISYQEERGWSNFILLIKYREGNKQNLLDNVKSVIGKNCPGYDAEYSFAGDRIKALYTRENKLSQTIMLGAVLVLIISTMGLFAISLYEAERRTKEIGIRKINGASVKNIILLLNKNMSFRVLLALVLACPVAWILARHWLQNFAYQTRVSWWLFAITGLTALLIAWLTTAYESIKAARRNPAETLRHE